MSGPLCYVVLGYTADQHIAWVIRMLLLSRTQPFEEKDLPLRPHPYSDRMSSETCTVCGHVAEGRTPFVFEVRVRRRLRMRPAAILCSSYTRDDSLGGVEYCLCRDLSHTRRVNARFEDHQHFVGE